MLDYTDIIEDVNKVISHSQGFNANAESLLKKWAVAKEEISNIFSISSMKCRHFRMNRETQSGLNEMK